MKVKTHSTTADVQAGLEKRFPPGEWALLFEVGNTTGYGTKRHADAIALNLWPSRGMALHGFEIKCWRGDFLREIKTPEKSEAVQKYCDYWWIVAGDDTIASVDELPETWGLLILRDKKLCVAKQAPKLKPEPITKGFMAAALRQIGNHYVAKSTFDMKLAEQCAAREKADAEVRERETKRREERVAYLENIVAEIERHAAVTIAHGRWSDKDPAEIGRALRVALTDGDAVAQRRLEMAGMAKRARQIAEDIEQRLGTSTEKRCDVITEAFNGGATQCLLSAGHEKRGEAHAFGEPS